MTATPNTDALLPCPFQHEGKRWKKDVPFISESSELGSRRFQVSCWHPDCPLHHTHSRKRYHDLVSAITAWNTRTPAPCVTSEDMQDLMENAFLAGGLPKDLNTLDWRSRLYLVEKAILTAFHLTKKEG